MDWGRLGNDGWPAYIEDCLRWCMKLRGHPFSEETTLKRLFWDLNILLADWTVKLMKLALDLLSPLSGTLTTSHLDPDENEVCWCRSIDTNQQPLSTKTINNFNITFSPREEIKIQLALKPSEHRFPESQIFKSVDFMEFCVFNLKTNA